MNISDIVDRSAEAIRADALFTGIPVIVEDKGDVANELAVAVGKRHLAVTVSWNGFASDGNSSKTIFGKANVTVTVREQPIINRRTPGAVTTLQAAAKIAYVLNLFTLDGDSSPLVFKQIGPVEYDSGESDKVTVACVVTFEASTTL